jgi:hypothetical protein
MPSTIFWVAYAIRAMFVVDTRLHGSALTFLLCGE